MHTYIHAYMLYDELGNKRGRLMEEFVIGNRIRIINEDCQLTTFESSRGTNNVNLTMADNKMVTLLNEWQCNELESFSDHRIITFRIEKKKKNRRTINKYASHGTKYITSVEGYKKFDDNFIAEIQHNFEISVT